MAEPKEKQKQAIKTRPAGRIGGRPNMLDRVKLPALHPIEEIISGPSPAQDASLAPPASHAPDASLAPIPPQALQDASLAPPASLAPDASLAASAIHIWDAIKEPSTGWTKVFGDIFNHLLRQMTPFEQAAYMQLYYLSWGRGNDTCKISYPTLAKRAGLKERSTFNAVQGLVSKGLIEKVDLDIGKGKEQGNHFRVVLPASLARLASHARDARLAPDATNKDKDIKKDIKSDSPSAEEKNCTRCGNTGFWYPQGIEKGVAKCDHKPLPS